MNFGASEVILFLIGQVIVAAAIWGGIRADIKGMHGRITKVEQAADRANDRLDRMFDRTNHGPL